MGIENLTLDDLNKIFQSAYSAVEAFGFEVGTACYPMSFLAAMRLREEYGITATVSAGSFAFNHGHGPKLLYGAVDAAGVVSATKEHFHMWVQADGYILDFTSPIYREVVDRWKQPDQKEVDWEFFGQRRFLKRKSSESVAHPFDLKVGDVSAWADEELAYQIVDGSLSGLIVNGLLPAERQFRKQSRVHIMTQKRGRLQERTEIAASAYY